jgi:Domain of unknown function (DUF4263)
MATGKANLIIKKNADGEVVAQINKKTKRGEYFLAADAKQAQFISAIELIGFDKLPSGFFSSGSGLTSSGFFITEKIFNKWKRKIRVVVSASSPSKINRQGRSITLQIKHTDLLRLNQTYRKIKTQGTAAIREDVTDFLNDLSPQHFPVGKKKTSRDYSAGELAALLKKKEILDNLDDSDRDELNEFIPEYVSRIPITLKSSKKLQVVFDLLDAGQRVYLKKIIEEFEKRLRATIQNENSWQEFLRKYILIFRNTYGEILEKESVALEGKFPDFILIDPYNYLDIYEIKRPDTRLLDYDKSRQNYYWHKEMAKAISQVENYIHQVQRNSDTLINDIRRKKSLDINIVRPRGYIIAGRRSQITSTTMENHFRILNESLKNVDVILYDDLLDGLKTFIERVVGK